MPRGEDPDDGARGERRLRSDARRRARHPERLYALPPGPETRRDESRQPLERPDRGPQMAIQARPADAAPPAVLARRPVVPDSRPVSRRLSGVEGTKRWRRDEGRLHARPQARAAAAQSDAVRRAVRQGPLARQSPPAGGGGVLMADG